jgi:hypothetical protein
MAMPETTDEKLSRILTNVFKRTGLPGHDKPVDFVVVEGEAVYLRCEGWDYVHRYRLAPDTVDKLAVAEEHMQDWPVIGLLPWRAEENSWGTLWTVPRRYRH